MREIRKRKRWVATYLRRVCVVFVVTVVPRDFVFLAIQ